MYTVCWVEFTGGEDIVRDKWERCDGREDVIHLLDKHGLEDDPDVLIFGPGADEHILTPSDFVSE